MKMPKKIYIMYHDKGKESWYEAQDDMQTFSQEGPVALYEISGKKKNLKILNILQDKEK